MANNKFILASASSRRKILLKKILRKYRVITSNADESKIKAPSPILFAKKAAIAKAKDVAKSHKDSVVIGADTIVVLDGQILGKPKDKKHAIEMLKRLSGKSHKVITGIAIVLPNGKAISDAAVTKLKMKKLSYNEILDYVNTGSSLDKAGGYGIQELDDAFIEKIEGDFDNVVGLPVYLLKKMLKSIL